MQRCSGELQTAGALGGTGIEASIDHGEASGRWVEPGKDALLFVSTAIAVGAAFGLSAGLGRILDERSFAGFTVLLAVALAAPLTWLVAVGEARPRWWVAIGLACLIALQVADVVAAWWSIPSTRGRTQPPRRWPGWCSCSRWWRWPGHGSPNRIGGSGSGGSPSAPSQPRSWSSPPRPSRRVWSSWPTGDRTRRRPAISGCWRRPCCWRAAPWS